LSAINRIGLLTGGGDCPGLNAVIRAVTRSAIHNGIEVMGVLDGFNGLITDQFQPLSARDVSGILPRGGTILGTSNKDDPFRCRETAPDGEVTFTDRSDEAVANMERAGIQALIVTGGDGSQTIGLKLCDKGVQVVGIPKTIDNDLMGTDITFGFDSALQCATDALDRLHTTAESHHRVMVLEVMGRNSGWIALMSGIAGGGDIILIPEIDFTFENIVKRIHERRDSGRRFSIIVAAEGARLPDGSVVSRMAPSGNTVLGGVGVVVARRVEADSGMESRVTVLGHLQRGGSPSPFDRILATRFGVKAVEMVMDGQFSRMVCLKTPEISSVPIEEAVASRKNVPPDGETVRFARLVGVSFGDR
jgi:phosphofructokinase-like protein